MQNSDIWLLRAVGFTLCASAITLVVTVASAQFSDFEIDPVLDRLTFLLLGGLLTAFSTKFTGKEPVEVETAEGDALAVEPAPRTRRGSAKAKEVNDIVTGE